MPLYMLDTNICIYLMKKQPKEVAERFAQCSIGDVVMSAITYAELQYGVAASADPERERANLANLIEDILVAPFDAAARSCLRTDSPRYPQQPGGPSRQADRRSRRRARRRRRHQQCSRFRQIPWHRCRELVDAHALTPPRQRPTS